MGWRRAASSLVLAVLVLTPAARTLCAMACAPRPVPQSAETVAAAAQTGHAHAHHAPSPRPDVDRSCAPAPRRPCDPAAVALSTALAATRVTGDDASPGTPALRASRIVVEARTRRAPIPRHRAGPAAGPPRAAIPLRI